MEAGDKHVDRQLQDTGEAGGEHDEHGHRSPQDSGGTGDRNYLLTVVEETSKYDTNTLDMTLVSSLQTIIFKILYESYQQIIQTFALIFKDHLADYMTT